jgi:hypothetical protein
VGVFLNRKLHIFHTTILCKSIIKIIEKNATEIMYESKKHTENCKHSKLPEEEGADCFYNLYSYHIVTTPHEHDTTSAQAFLC